MKNELLELLDDSTDTDNFITHGEFSTLIPGLTVKGLGSVSFPVIESQA